MFKILLRELAIIVVGSALKYASTLIQRKGEDLGLDTRDSQRPE